MSRPSWAAALSALALLSGCGPPDAAMAGGRAVRTESPAGPRSVLPRLLLLDWFGSSPVATPATVRDHQAFLESGPFDGLALYLRSPDLATNITASVLGETRVAPADIDRVLEPLEALRFERLLHNYAAVQSQNPPDLFDDWTGVVWNFTQLARSARRVHLEGIVLDNENYGRRWADYPAGVAYPQKSLREYQDQAFLRGRQVMEGMTSVFPELSLLVLHGPYLSERRAPHPLFPDWERTNLLQGPFFAGLVDGAGAAATVIDGGELYHLRSDRDFQDSYEWRRAELPSERTPSAWLRPAVRARWGSRVGIAFGLYDRPFDGAPMDPRILRRTLERALARTDAVVWLYVEGPSFLLPPEQGGAGAEWVTAVREGKAAGLRRRSP